MSRLCAPRREGPERGHHRNKSHCHVIYERKSIKSEKKQHLLSLGITHFVEYDEEPLESVNSLSKISTNSTNIV